MELLDNVKSLFTGQGRLYAIVAVVLIALIGFGYIGFYALAMAPQLKLREKLVSQVTLARTEARKAELAARSSESVDGYTEDIKAAEAELEKAAQAFLTESQAAELLDAVYQYSGESGVEILRLENRPSPEEKSDVYDARLFELEVVGALPSLMDFVSRIKEASHKSVHLSEVSVPKAEMEPHRLIMNIVIYTSPYAWEDAQGTVKESTAEQGLERLPQLREALSAAWASAKWQEAVGLIIRILAIAPEDTEMTDKLYVARVNFGFELLGRGEYPGAEMQFTLALQSKPGGQEALAGLDQVAANLGGMATATSAASPGPTPGQAGPTENPYLVRPTNWPTELPWPPRGK